MLTKDQKKQLVKDIAKKVKEAKSVVFADFRGLKVKDMTMLKKGLRAEKSALHVVKKTLIERSLSEVGISMDIESLDGQIAMAFSPDEVAGARVIDNFSKTNENIKILGGILENNPVSASQMKALAKLPDKEILLGQFVRSLNAPVTSLVNVLAGNIRGLVQVLKAISENKV